jgi:hypothetical protein
VVGARTEIKDRVDDHGRNDDGCAPARRESRRESEPPIRAATVVEDIALGWPTVLERLGEIDATARTAALNGQKGKQAAGDAVARQKALEQAVAGALNISLTGGG